MPLGYVAACIGAATMIALGLFGTDVEQEYAVYFTASIVIMTFWTGSVAFVPATIAIVLAEAFAWRSLFYYLLIGGAIGLIGDQLAFYSDTLEFAEHRLAILPAGGFAGGFIYWLIAGRLAGTAASQESRA